MCVEQEVMKMPASVQGVGAGMLNLAASLIVKSMQQLPAAPKTPSRNHRGSEVSTPPPADSRQIDVKA